MVNSIYWEEVISMGKNKLLLVLVIGFVSLFGFKIDVYAAQELTCLYEKGGGALFGYDKVLLIQDSDGNITIYKNDDDAKISDTGWHLSNDERDFSDISLKNYWDDDYHLKKCPESKTTDTSIGASGKVTFYSKGIGKENTEATQEKVLLPGDVSAVTGKSLEELVWNYSCEDLIKMGILDKTKKDLIFSPPYDVNCIYYYTSSYADINKCYLFQISFDSESGVFKHGMYSPSSGNNKGKVVEPRVQAFDKSYLFFVKTYRNIKSEDLLKYQGACPVQIEILNENDSTPIIYIDSDSPNMKRIVATTIDLDIPSLFESTEGAKIESCADALGSVGVGALKFVYNIIRIGVPIILLVLGTLDFAQAIFAQDESGIKKAQGKFVKRLIIAVVIFLIPIVLSMLLNLANSIWPNIKVDLCGILD